ncbi:hypothetical protein [Vibrio alginolyticus]|uniref:hypothetical protein n=1 Tax=Vibrio alginolyticus TaxID=663 RepID=UPI003D7D672F
MMIKHLIELYRPSWSFHEACAVAKEISATLDTNVTVGYDENITGERVLRIALEADAHLVHVDVTKKWLHKKNGTTINHSKFSVPTLEEAKKIESDSQSNLDLIVSISPRYEYPAVKRWNLLKHDSARDLPF